MRKLVFLISISTVVATAAPLSSAPIDNDDLLACTDVEKVSYYKLDASLALKACSGASIAMPNSPDTQYNYGIALLKSRMYESALRTFRRAVELGSIKAEYSIAYMYMYGFGVQRDMDEAYKWILSSANKGNAGGQNALGFLYRMGQKVKKDQTAANAWFRKAVAQDHSQAHFNLAMSYEQGLGVPEDRQEAERLYARALLLGDQSAIERQKRIASGSKTLSGGDVMNFLIGTIVDAAISEGSPSGGDNYSDLPPYARNWSDAAKAHYREQERANQEYRQRQTREREEFEFNCLVLSSC